MRQDEHVSLDNKSVAVATVVAAVDQARSRGPSEAAVSGEQVDRRCQLPSLLSCHFIPLSSQFFICLLFLAILISSYVSNFRY